MLTHIVCWKYKVETSVAARENHVARLRALTGVIDCIDAFEVGTDILHLERSFDTGLVATFANESALAQYTIHPEHQKVAALGKEIADQVISVDFLS